MSTRMADNKDEGDDLRPEYDFSSLRRRGARGEYAGRYRAGTNLVLLEPDVAAVFHTDEEVNKALRSLIANSRREGQEAS